MYEHSTLPPQSKVEEYGSIFPGPWAFRRSLRPLVHARNPLVGGHWSTGGVGGIRDFTCFSVNGQREVASQCVKISQSEIQYMHTMCNRLGCRRRLRSHLDEKRDSYEANNHQGGASDEHVTDMISCRARAHRYLVVVSDDRTFMGIHRKLLSWAQHGPLLETLERLRCSESFAR
jgi:hypothetical protein